MPAESLSSWPRGNQGLGGGVSCWRNGMDPHIPGVAIEGAQKGDIFQLMKMLQGKGSRQGDGKINLNTCKAKRL